MSEHANIRSIGNIVAPWRFIVFALIAIIGMMILIPMTGWRRGVMISFDVLAIIFMDGPPLTNGADWRRIRGEDHDQDDCRRAGDRPRQE